MPITETEEKNAIDNITNTMFSVAFLKEITDFMFSAGRNELSVGRYYDKWKASIGQDKTPFSPGIILGELYVAIVYGKEIWFDIIPDTEINAVTTDWGITHVRYMYPINPHPSLRDIIRRLRNALAHSNVKIVIPEGTTNKNMLDTISIKFHDEKPDGTDTFDAELKLNELFRFIQKFQSHVHDHVRSKYNIT